jgi:hypothetical protein
MDLQVCLLISLQIERPEGDTARYRLFEDACQYLSPLPEDFSRQSDID